MQQSETRSFHDYQIFLHANETWTVSQETAPGKTKPEAVSCERGIHSKLPLAGSSARQTNGISVLEFGFARFARERNAKVHPDSLALLKYFPKLRLTECAKTGMARKFLMLLQSCHHRRHQGLAARRYEEAVEKEMVIYTLQTIVVFLKNKQNSKILIYSTLHSSYNTEEF